MTCVVMVGRHVWDCSVEQGLVVMPIRGLISSVIYKVYQLFCTLERDVCKIAVDSTG